MACKIFGNIFFICRYAIRYANGVHLSAIWESTALVQWIRCEPLGEHLIHWTCAVFSHIARKMNNVCIFSHDQVTHDITLPYIVLNLQLEYHMGWYRYTSPSENYSKECGKQSVWCRSCHITATQNIQNDIKDCYMCERTLVRDKYPDFHLQNFRQFFFQNLSNTIPQHAAKLYDSKIGRLLANAISNFKSQKDFN